MVYARNFNIKNSSDLDLVVICESFPNVPILQNVLLINEIRDFYNTNKPVEICFKFFMDQKEIMLHVTQSQYFEMVCNTDFFSVPNTLCSYRSIRRDTLKYDNRYTFDGSEFIWNFNLDFDDPFQKIPQKIFDLDNSKSFINGIITDLYFISKFWFGNEKYYKENKNALRLNLLKRLNYEINNKIVKDDSHLFKAMARHNKFPQYFINSLLILEDNNGFDET